MSQRNSAIDRMACDGAAGALLADNPVSLFKSRNVSLDFCVPAEAETVSERINPAEPIQVALVDASARSILKV